MDMEYINCSIKDCYLENQELRSINFNLQKRYDRLDEAYININKLYQKSVKDTAKKIFDEFNIALMHYDINDKFNKKQVLNILEDIIKKRTEI